MKQWIALLVAFLLLFSGVLVDAIVNSDPVSAGAGNGTSETVESAAEFAELLASLPSVDAYYAAFAPKSEGAGGEGGAGTVEAEDKTAFLGANFKPLTLDTTSQITDYISYYSSKEEWIEPEEGETIDVYKKEISTETKKDYRDFDRSMTIHYLSDGLLMICDATMRTGTIVSERIKEHKLSSPNPDPRDEYELNTYHIDNYHIICSLYLREGKVFMKYDRYDLTHEHYVDRLEYGRYGFQVVSTEQLEDPDVNKQERKITDETVAAINADFLGVWFDLHHEAGSLEDLTADMENMSEEEYNALSKEAKEELNKKAIEVMVGQQVSAIGEGYATMLIDIANETAQSFAFFAEYLKTAESWLKDSGKKFFVAESDRGESENRRRYGDFAISFLEERNFYPEGAFEQQRQARAAYEEAIEAGEEPTEKPGIPYTYNEPRGNFTISFLNPIEPMLKYQVEAGYYYYGYGNSTGTATMAMRVNLTEGVTIRNVGNVALKGPDKVKKDLFDLIYPILLDIMTEEESNDE